MPLKSKDMIDANDPRVAQIGHPAPPWMVNYADLMTELVCFFLILYALSSALSKPLQEASKAVTASMDRKAVDAEVKITKDGLEITLKEQGYHVFFESGSSNLTDDMKDILDELAPTLVDLSNKGHEVLVEGHTDDVPIKSPLFASNWELSTGRATTVVQFLINVHGFPPHMIGATGYGHHHNLPREKDEDLNAWRSKNRRVVFLVKNQEPGAAEKQKKLMEEKKEPVKEETAAS